MDVVIGPGQEPGKLSVLQITSRGIIMFFATLVMVRLADKRSFAKHTAFDIILGLIIASTLSRCINGSAPFFPTICLGFVLVGLHRLLAWVACRHRWLGILLKGTDDILIQKGRVLAERLKHHHLSDHDLHEGLRIGGSINSVEEVEEARIERNGEITVIRRKSG